MSDLDADAGRNFEGLDARAAQEALAEELAGEMNEKSDAPEAATPADGAEIQEAPIVREWSPEEAAGHRRMIEALLFAATEPLNEAALAERLPAGADIAGGLAALAEDYAGRGVVLSKIAGKWRFVTATDLAHILESERVEPRRLSRAALETLAIVAYHQPCTRADIEDVRGVQVSKGSLDQLLEVGWVRLRGRRKDAPGRPVLYGTTQAFLEHFGLESVADLPGMADLKAAGLLDARLPPGFAVPMPSDASDDEDFGGDEDESAEFATDFLGEPGEEANGE
jgi:segregation and condensation protein B